MSLTQTAYMSRQLIKYGGIGLVVFVFLWMSISAGYKAYIKANPPYVSPTVRYGLLPKIVFPEKQTTEKKFSFEWPSDTVPSFKDQAKVYVIYRPNTTFLALEEDTKTAKSFGFETTPNQVKTGVYEFKNDSLNKTLVVNVLDGDFKITYPYTSDQLLLDSKDVPKKDDAIDIASSFLKKGEKLTTDLEEGNKKVTFWQIKSDGLIAANSQSESNAARVDFFRKDLDGFELLSSNYGQASVSVLISGSDIEGKRIIEVNFKDTNIDRESYSTYPIKTANEAVNELVKGNYWTAVDVNKPGVVIRDISLAYFEPTTLTNYLLPIYVFRGDDNFVAYVSAINEKYLK